MPIRYPPDDPREWLNRARSNLVLAQTPGEGIYLEDLCFNLQQAVEKAIKALLIKHGVPFPYVHDIGELLILLEDVGQSVPEIIRQSAPHPLCCVHALSRSCPAYRS
jgi:HEPN domain-containing protein